VKKRTLGFSIFIVVFAVAIYIAYNNKQFIKDNFVVLTTDLTPESNSLGAKLALTDEGDFLYQASQTDFEKSADFKSSCGGIEKQAIVLGCYTKQRIYIYDVTDKKLEGVRETTAAHEVLHAAYERLSDSQKSEVDKMLLKQSEVLTDKRVKDTLALYKDLNKDELFNEMHSIFGTELRSLSPELEEYYKKYFTNRSAVVDYSDKYQSVFKKLKIKADSLKAQLKTLTQLKKDNELILQYQKSAIDSQQLKLNALKNTDISSYNSAVPSFNQSISTYNTLVAEYKSLIEQMNKIITEINSNITEQNSLTKKLDSNYAPIE